MIPSAYTLDLADTPDAPLCGAKAARLGRMLRAGLPVPPGFLIPAAARLAPHAEVESAIRAAYRSLGAGPVAVRSSASLEDLPEASMAGQLDTVLDVHGEEAVIAAVRRCWAGADNPRVKAYLDNRRLAAADLHIAVLVQQLVAADKAGVMFTQGPPAADPQQRPTILIEANWGLGETVVSGMVQPDSITLDKATGRILSERLGSKEQRLTPGRGLETVPPDRRTIRCLTDPELLALADMARRVEELFAAPQDIEWAIAKGRLWLLQSRAITAPVAVPATPATPAIAQVRAQLRELVARSRKTWVRHNLGETVPHPTPLTWSVLRPFMAGSGGYGAMHRMIGYEPGSLVLHEGFLELIGGRIYMDLRRASEMFAESFGLRYDLALIRRNPAAAQDGPTRAAGGFRTRMAANRRVAHAHRRLQALSRDLDHTLDQQRFPEFRAWVEQERARDLRALDADAWADLWRSRQRRVMDEFAPWTLLPATVHGWALERLRAFLAERFWDEDATALANLLAAGAARGDATMCAGEDLFRVGRGELSVEQWLRDYGHRGPGTFDLAAPRWREIPDTVRTMARQLTTGTGPAQARQVRVAEAQRRLAELAARLAPRHAAQLQQHVALARRYVRFREDGKHELMRGYALLRELLLDAARRLDAAPDDLALLTFDELTAALRANSVDRNLLAQRRDERAAEEPLTLPPVITDADVDTLGHAAPPAPHGDRLVGLGLSPGDARGPVRVVLQPTTASAADPGYVLVCPSTDPGWTPWFINAAAIVMERGGMLSHGAVVARELGKPAVVLPDATRILRDGDRVTVDGTAGAVVRSGPTGSAAISATPAAADTHIAPTQTPPAEGPFERLGARLSTLGFIIWGIYLLLVWLAPGLGLWDFSMRLLDAALWPVIRSCGRHGAVAIFAVAMAAISMLAQWAAADVRRLRVVKRRAAALRKEADTLPADAPRADALFALIIPAQWRIARAGFVPLAILLGPMVMAFLWLGERIDLSAANPPPGASVVVTAFIDGEFRGDLTAHADGGAEILGPATQSTLPIRQALIQMENALSTQQIPTLPPDVQNALGNRNPQDLLRDLRAFLGRKLPPQLLSWTLRTPPGSGGAYRVTISTDNADTAQAVILAGDAVPPPLHAVPEGPSRAVDFPATPAGVIQFLRVRYTDTRPAEERIFWRPLARLGWNWDAGWLTEYMLLYLAAMALTRRALRIP